MPASTKYHRAPDEDWEKACGLSVSDATDEDHARGLLVTRAWLDEKLSTAPKRSAIRARERAMVAVAKTGIQTWMLDSL